jgi:hypothetical protein
VAPHSGATVDLRFERRVDGTAYRFRPAGTTDGYPAYRRDDDADVWCRRLPGFGWSVCTDAGAVLARPFADAGQGEIPPHGMWVSAKDDRAYVYDLTVAAATGSRG